MLRKSNDLRFPVIAWPGKLPFRTNIRFNSAWLDSSLEKRLFSAKRWALNFESVFWNSKNCFLKVSFEFSWTQACHKEWNSVLTGTSKIQVNSIPEIWHASLSCHSRLRKFRLSCMIGWLASLAIISNEQYEMPVEKGFKKQDPFKLQRKSLAATMGRENAKEVSSRAQGPANGFGWVLLRASTC